MLHGSTWQNDESVVTKNACQPINQSSVEKLKTANARRRGRDDDTTERWRCRSLGRRGWGEEILTTGASLPLPVLQLLSSQLIDYYSTEGG